MYKERFFYIRGLLRRYPHFPRVAGLSLAAAFLAGAALLVSFAIFSPELPPENLFSKIDDIAAYYQNPDSSWLSSRVVLPLEDKDWASISTLQSEEDITGAGTQTIDRTEDIEYRIRPGETLSEIAYAYDLPYELLAWYNKIANVNRIRVGTLIVIPSLENAQAAEIRMAGEPRKAPSPRTSTRSVTIGFESRNNGEMDGSGVTVQFSVLNPPAESLQSFEWDFGDGKRGFRPNPSYEYSTPKTYVVRLTARDTGGVIYKSNPLYIDIPHPDSVADRNTTKFVTLSSPDELFVVKGEIAKVARYSSVEESPLDLSESDQFLTKVRFQKPGYYGLTVTESSGGRQYYSVFVSPIPSMHADADLTNFNWYRTQFNTGTTSNCGPASTAMAISWGTGKYYPVSSARQAVGWQGDGGTSFEELIGVIRKEGINAGISSLRSVQDIRDVIDSGSIAIILFRTDGVKTSSADPGTDSFGKYYNDSVGHYIIVKGYSLNGEYFIIHDPIPSDWGANSFRYQDEISMIGRNRYYSSAELLKSLRRPNMIVVPQA
jgi:PKD repeat protein